MEFVNTVLREITLPDIFIVAARSWGIEVPCLSLIPTFFTAIASFVGSVGAWQLSKYNKGNNVEWYWVGVTGSLLLFTVLHLVHWFALLQISKGVSENFLPFNILLSVEGILFVVVWILILSLYRTASLRVKTHLFLALIFGVVALFASYRAFELIQATKIILLISESLLFVSLGYVTVFIQKSLTSVKGNTS